MNKNKKFIKIVFLFSALVIVFLLFGGLRNLSSMYYSFLTDENIINNLNATYAKADKKTEGIIRFPDMRCISRNATKQKDIVWKFEIGKKLKEMINPKLKENLRTESARSICRQSEYNYLLQERNFRFLIEYYDAEKNFIFFIPIDSKECRRVQSLPPTKPVSPQKIQQGQVQSQEPKEPAQPKEPTPPKEPSPPKAPNGPQGQYGHPEAPKPPQKPAPPNAPGGRQAF